MYAKKSLGQNFIHDNNFIKKLSSAIKTSPQITIIEIGPGKGALTNELLKKEYKNLIAIEKDDSLIKSLRKLEFIGKNFKLIHDDALRVDYEELSNKNSIIVGNLPFNISSQLLVKWIFNSKWPPSYNKMYLMFQKEVAERIVATHGNKKYGRLSIITQSRCVIRKLMIAKASIFSPVPKVDGVVLELTPHNKHSNIDIKLLEKIVKQAFSQRRKKIKTNLKDYMEVLRKIGVDIELRPEDIPVDIYCKMATK